MILVRIEDGKPPVIYELKDIADVVFRGNRRFVPVHYRPMSRRFIPHLGFGISEKIKVRSLLCNAGYVAIDVDVESAMHRINILKTIHAA